MKKKSASVFFTVAVSPDAEPRRQQLREARTAWKQKRWEFSQRVDAAEVETCLKQEAVLWERYRALLRQGKPAEKEAAS